MFCTRLHVLYYLDNVPSYNSGILILFALRSIGSWKPVANETTLGAGQGKSHPCNPSAWVWNQQRYLYHGQCRVYVLALFETLKPYSKIVWTILQECVSPHPRARSRMCNFVCKTEKQATNRQRTSSFSLAEVWMAWRGRRRTDCIVISVSSLKDEYLITVDSGTGRLLMCLMSWEDNRIDSWCGSQCCICTMCTQCSTIQEPCMSVSFSAGMWLLK